MGSVRVAVDEGDVCLEEAGVGEHLFEFGFAEAQPLVGVEVACFFEAMFRQVENDDAAAGAKDAVSLSEGALGMQGVVQRLGEEGQVDGG